MNPHQAFFFFLSYQLHRLHLRLAYFLHHLLASYLFFHLFQLLYLLHHLLALFLLFHLFQQLQLHLQDFLAFFQVSFYLLPFQIYLNHYHNFCIKFLDLFLLYPHHLSQVSFYQQYHLVQVNHLLLLYIFFYFFSQ